MAQRMLVSYYLYVTLTGLFRGACFVTFVIFLQRHGLDAFERNLVNSFFMLTIVIAEIPTGVIADVFGRRRSILCSQICMMVGGLVYFNSSSLHYFIIAEVIIGIGITCESGALGAWITDSLDHYKHTYSRQYIYATASICAQVALIAGGVIGAYLGTLDKFARYPWLFHSGGAGLLALYVLYVMKEPYSVKTFTSFKLASEHAWLVLTASWRCCYKSYNMRVLFGTVAACLFGFQSLNMLWSVKYVKVLGLEKLAWQVWVPMMLFLTLGSYVAKRVSHRSDIRRLFFINMVFISVCIYGATNQIFFVSIIMFCMHEVGRGFIGPVTSAMIDDQIDCELSQGNLVLEAYEVRATIKSLASMARSGGSYSGLLIMGAVTNATSINTAWTVSAIWLVVVGCVFFVLFHKK